MGSRFVHGTHRPLAVTTRPVSGGEEVPRVLQVHRLQLGVPKGHLDVRMAHPLLDEHEVLGLGVEPRGAGVAQRVGDEPLVVREAHTLPSEVPSVADGGRRGPQEGVFTVPLQEDLGGLLSAIPFYR